MERRNLQPDELDLIGEKLIASAVLSENELEKISASPYLFKAIRSRNEAAEEKASTAWIRPLVFAFSSVGALFIVAAIGVYVISEPPSRVAQTTPEVTAPPVPSRSETAPLRDFASDPIPDVDSAAISSEPQFQNAVYRKPQRSKPQRTRAEKLPDIEFYPITHQGDPNEMARGGRIIRVEMPRSALFAMGVNVPLENGAETITADLLVGPDGVTRAIRMPNQDF